MTAQPELANSGSLARCGGILLSRLLTAAIMGLVAGLALSIVALPIFIWGAKDAPSFYGSFAAAIVAAIAVILGSSYQHHLDSQREEHQREQDQIGIAIELSFWLRHAANEMTFVSSVLERMEEFLRSKPDEPPSLTLEQFRDIVTPHFFDELRAKARDGAKLPHELSRDVSRVIYATYTITDRILALRGAAASYRPTAEALSEYAKVTKTRAEQLVMAAQNIESWLSKNSVAFDAAA